MPTIVVANYAQAVWPGIESFFGVAYNRFRNQWQDLFEQRQSDKEFERNVLHSGLTTLRQKDEIGAIEYDFMKQVFTIDTYHTQYALGVSISRQALDDNLYSELPLQRAEEMANKAAITKEILAAIFMSKVFSSSAMAYADGKAVCAVDHPLARGGTFANTPTNGEDLSESSLENALIGIQNMKDETGNKVDIRGVTLFVPNELQFDAERICGNPLRPGTADRDINAMYQMGKLPGGFKVNNYLTDPDAWFIKTDCNNGLVHYERWPVEITNDTADFDTENMRMKVIFRDSRTILNVRGLWGSPGA